MKHDPFQCVEAAPIFHNLSKKAITELTKISVHQQLYPKGTMLYEPEVPLDRMLIVDQGRVKVFQLSQTGQEKILYFIDQGSMDSEAALFTQQLHFNYAEAMEDTLVCSIGRSDFQALLKEEPSIAIAMLNVLGDRLTRLEALNSYTSTLTSKQRLQNYLMDIGNKRHERSFELPMKKKDLANWLGITPETLSRQFKQLQKDQLIKLERNQVTIL